MSAPEPRWTPADYAMLDAGTRRVSAEWDEHVEQAVGLTRPAMPDRAPWAAWVVLALVFLVVLAWGALLVWLGWLGLTALAAWLGTTRLLAAAAVALGAGVVAFVRWADRW